MHRLLVLLGLLVTAAAVFAGCGEDVTSTSSSSSSGSTSSGSSSSSSSSSSGGGSHAGGTSHKVDLLLVIDNSRSMADKQRVLAAGASHITGAFINPPCVDEAGALGGEQPADASQPCPEGTKRLFAPVTDLHVGVVSSSLGGHGADACNLEADPTGNASVNDQAHLLARTSPSGGGTVPTYQNQGFLAWDPGRDLEPPGTSDPAELEAGVVDIVNGVGEVGCGYEAPLEAWYRFLVDPDPYEKITLNDKMQAVLEGTDSVLLEQRKAFLRPDSLLAILLLSDENDCSIKDGGQYYFAEQIFAPGSQSAPYHLPKPRAACAEDPNDPCCRSCGQSGGEGCDQSKDDCSGSLSPEDDQINLRCFDQKRRFGIDFLQPIDRYVAGLTSPQVPDRLGNLVANPVFAGKRDASMVYFAAIAGVPWQDIARRNGQGKPDLAAGLGANGKPVGGLQSAAELVQSGVWDVILGDPASYVQPTDPLMIESIEPRQGTNPVTGDVIAPPGAKIMANPINGHEYSIPASNDLQYACIFSLKVPRDCQDPSQTACDCADPYNDNPLCQAGDSSFDQTQYYAKAYPGRRHLQLLKAVGTQGVTGSVCPAQTADAAQPDFGYRPLLRALGEAMRGSIVAPPP
ncbi:MAG: hypothetical protein HY744_29350 [Deltaproteobacteria bacterium]|nr:hypothetical protein [Deltaproteobacteria bacterium]